MNRRMNRAVLLVLGLGLTGLGSCMSIGPSAEMPVNHYFADARDVKTVKRILVLPLRVGNGVKVDEGMVRQAFIRELNLLQRFQVEALPPGESEEVAINAAFGHGEISTPSLINLSRRYKLDGIMVGRITSYRAYDPPHVGIEARLFSLHTGSWVWIADATFDTMNAACVADLNHYAQYSLPDSDVTKRQSRLVAMAPRRFAAYACHRILGTWRAD